METSEETAKFFEQLRNDRPNDPRLAEHLGFDLSFLIAGASTVALFSINTDWVFRSRKLAGRALGVFTLLYAFIYVLLRVEAYALLVGAIASFAAVAAAMYITRNIGLQRNQIREFSVVLLAPDLITVASINQR